MLATREQIREWVGPQTYEETVAALDSINVKWRFQSEVSLTSGSELQSGQSVRSPDGRFSLTLQADGNLVWQEGDAVLWHSGTDGTEEAKCCMQADGNLVIYGKREGTVVPIWASETSGLSGATLSCQNDANLVIYHGSAAGWASNTARNDPGLNLAVNGIVRLHVAPRMQTVILAIANGRYGLQIWPAEAWAGIRRLVDHQILARP